MKILLSIMMLAAVAAEPGIIGDFVQAIKGKTADRSGVEDAQPMYGGDLRTNTTELNNTQEISTDQENPDDRKTPSIYFKFFKFMFDALDRLLVKPEGDYKPDQFFGESPESEMDYTYLGIPRNIYMHYANMGVVPVPNKGLCSCPFQLQLYAGPQFGRGSHQHIPLDGGLNNEDTPFLNQGHLGRDRVLSRRREPLTENPLKAKPFDDDRNKFNKMSNPDDHNQYKRYQEQSTEEF